MDFEVFSTIKEFHADHGASLGDFHRYQQYCTRKLHRLRKNLHHTAPRTKRPKPIDAESIKSPRFFLIPLLEAERAWAHSMYLKQQAATQKSKKIMYHAIKRLSKAVIHAQKLHSLTKETASEKTQSETEQYLSQLTHALSFEKSTGVSGDIEQTLGSLSLSLPAVPTLMRSILALNDALNRLDNTVLSELDDDALLETFEPLLMKLGDAELALRQSQSAASQESWPSMKKALDYVETEVTQRTIQRNLLLALRKKEMVSKSKAKASEVVRILETLITNSENLPEDFAIPIMMAFRSLRVFYVATSFHQALQVSTASALYGESTEQLHRATLVLDQLTFSNKFCNGLLEWVKLSLEQSKVYKCTVVADAVLDSTSSLVQQSYLNFETGELSLVDYPPKLTPVNVKPVFLDLAFNCFDFPDLSNRIASLEKSEKRGLFGFRKKK
ncbi:hypothetical protein GEMRC1_006757 [Eukaryota sp. GEM-RC1]